MTGVTVAVHDHPARAAGEAPPPAAQVTELVVVVDVAALPVPAEGMRLVVAGAPAGQ